MEDDDLSKLERLRQMIDEGDESGEPKPFDFELFIEEKLRQLDPRQ